ncbi:MAG: hypothetical protein L0Z51_05780 [Candidatus Latescibacteria bacterium]|nr:hypothetical protein [Candidatus Latescibacterota bacterium]
MKQTIGIILLAALAASGPFAPAPVHAQADAPNVQAFIERNDELLSFAAGVVMETNSTKARSLLETARGLHAQSVTLLEQNAPGMAFRVAVRAREVIQQTIAVAKREARVDEQAQKAIERATARLEQARALFEDAGGADPNVRRLLMESADNLRRARDQMHQHMFETALRLAVSSSDLSSRAIRMMRRDAGAGDVTDDIERTQDILDRLADARPTLPPALVKLADQAGEMQRRATASAERGDVERAREETRGARALALRALRAAGPADETAEERALRAVSLTDELLDRARAVALESNDEMLARSLEEAVRLQESAREALLRSDFETATRLSMRARDAAREALRKVEADLDPAAVEAALSRTDDAIARAKDALADAGDAQAQGLIERAQARQTEAKDAFASDDLRRALALTKIAHNLASQALRRIGDAVR